MEKMPHHYIVSGKCEEHGVVKLGSEGLNTLEITPPPQFGGPEGYWSPETLVTGALVTCFILTFRAIARASKYPFEELSCDAEGLLERKDGNSIFTQVSLKAILTIREGSDVEKGLTLVQKAKSGCPISNSLVSTITLQAETRLV